MNEFQSPGRYCEVCDRSDLPDGKYYFTMQAGDFVLTRKMELEDQFLFTVKSPIGKFCYGTGFCLLCSGSNISHQKNSNFNVLVIFYDPLKIAEEL